MTDCLTGWTVVGLWLDTCHSSPVTLLGWAQLHNFTGLVTTRPTAIAKARDDEEGPDFVNGGCSEVPCVHWYTGGFECQAGVRIGIGPVTQITQIIDMIQRYTDIQYMIYSIHTVYSISTQLQLHM